MNHDESTNPTRLESWKEIAAYLQRDSTTARRWEKEEGLPVHRHSHKSRSSVYAYASEIDLWRASRKVVPEPVPARPLWKIPAFAVTMAMCLVMVGNGIRPVEAQSSRGAAKRPICSGDCADSEANLSPDGRSLVRTDWSTGDLVIRDMKSGKERRLMARTGSYQDKGDSGAFAEGPLFSPDGKQIAYFWDSEAQLRVMANETGGKSRVLVDNPDYAYVEADAWSPDGKSLLVSTKKKDLTWQIAWVSLSDGAVKPLVSLDWRAPGALSEPALSPDGRYIVYAARAVNPKRPGNNEPGDIHIYLMASDGTGTTELVKTAGVNKYPAWTPDGRHVLFLSDRSGTLGLWSIGVRDGKASGAATLVRPDMGNVEGVGVRSGAYYYVQNTPDVDYVSFVGMTPAGMKASDTAGEGFVGIAPQWSPDGKSISFKRHHLGSTDTFDLVVHSMETGDERTFATKSTANGVLQWFRDGRSVQVMLPQPPMPAKPFRVDVQTGEFKPQVAGGVVSKVDDTIYHLELDSNRIPIRSIATDLNTGQVHTLFAVPKLGKGAFPAALSADGKMLAVAWQDPEGPIKHFARVNVDGTGYREIYSASGLIISGGAFGLQWTKDGRGILFPQIGGGKSRIMRLSAEGGQPEFTGVEVTGSLQYWDLSPDGTRLAINIPKTLSELWEIDNIASLLK